MKIGIAIDAWKLSIFERRLKEAGFQFERGPLPAVDGGVLPDAFLLSVETDDKERLLRETKAANTEAAQTKRKDR